MMDFLELAIEQLHAAKLAGHPHFVLQLPKLTPANAALLLDAIRREGFTPAATFKGGRVCAMGSATGLSLEVSL